MTDLEEFVQYPSRWPLRPTLPVKRWQGDEIETGYLMEGQGLIVFAEPRMATAIYWTVDEMVEAGWQVD